MRKTVLLVLTMVLFSFSSASAQSFLKKAGDAAKKLVQTEEKKDTKQADQSLLPVSITVESTRIIGDKLLVSFKIQSSEDIRAMNIRSDMITPDGETYKMKALWWGGAPASTSTFDVNLITGINYAFDISYDIKSKQISQVASLTIELFNHTAQKQMKIPMKNIAVPNPHNPELDNRSVIEISKNIYMRWTGAEEGTDGLKISFIIINKNNNDQKIQFPGYANKATIIDTNGNSYEARNSLDNNIIFPAGTPIAGNITLDKPLKINQIALLEFSTSYFNYRIKGIVLPAE